MERAKKSRKGKAMVGIVALAAVGGGFALNLLPATAAPATIGEVDLEGMSRPDAEKALAAWWDDQSQRQVSFTSDDLTENPPAFLTSDFGIELDVEETLRDVEWRRFWPSLVAQAKAMQTPEQAKEIALRYTEAEPNKELADFVAAKAKEPREASATYKDGKIVLVREIGEIELAPERLRDAVVAALESGEPQPLPTKAGTKKIPDAELEKITEVVTEYTTSFNAGQANRSSNIKRASEIIDGLIMMPGDEFSFNGHVGKRTVAGGFKVAGVYQSGRHAYDVGGGICQVSSTLYNAVLLADAEITQRSCHSLPVPYVPTGRDATVSYPSLDFKFKNNFSQPIAIQADYRPGKLTFRVLGKKEEGKEVVIERKPMGSWSNGVKYVEDSSLGYGKTKVVDRGGAGQKVATWRVVKKNGKVVEREDLGQSIYRGGPKIVARNSKAKPPAKPKPEEGGDAEKDKPAAKPASTEEPAAPAPSDDQ